MCDYTVEYNIKVRRQYGTNSGIKSKAVRYSSSQRSETGHFCSSLACPSFTLSLKQKHTHTHTQNKLKLHAKYTFCMSELKKLATNTH